MQLEPDHTAVVIVDMQNGFCHPDGSLYAPGSEAVIEPITDLLERARGAGSQVIFTRDVHPPEQFDDAHYYDEFEQWGEHVLEGSWEAEIVDELPVEDGDHVVEKHTYDAFYNTELEGWLNARNIDDLVICGTLANVCVLHTGGSAARGCETSGRSCSRTVSVPSRTTTASTPSITPRGSSARSNRARTSSSPESGVVRLYIVATETNYTPIATSLCD